MSANTPTVTSLLHKHAGARRRMQSRFRWDRAPKRAWELRSLSSNGKASHTEAEAFVLSWSSSQCHLTKEQCFQWAGLTRSEHIIGPFLGLHATRLSHRSLRQGAEHLAEGPAPLDRAYQSGHLLAQCNQLASHRKMPRGAGSGPCPAPRSKRHLSKWPAEPQRELDETPILTRPRRKGGERFDHQR